jgi:hypothetical protein
MLQTDNNKPAGFHDRFDSFHDGISTCCGVPACYGGGAIVCQNSREGKGKEPACAAGFARPAQGGSEAGLSRRARICRAWAAAWGGRDLHVRGDEIQRAEVDGLKSSAGLSSATGAEHCRSAAQHQHQLQIEQRNRDHRLVCNTWRDLPPRMRR